MDPFTIFILIIFGNMTYFTTLQLILWFENKGNMNKTLSKGFKLPSVSILIPAYNEENSIEQTLKNLLKINYPSKKLELIVIDDGSRDKTYQIAKKFESNSLKILKKENGGKASALNFGLKYAKNDFVAVIDADSTIAKNALRNCMKYFDEKDVGAVTSHVLVKNKNKILTKMQNIEMMIVSMLRKTHEYLNAINATPGPLSVYRKDTLIQIGGFDERNLTEDAEISWRLIRNNYKVRLAFDAFSYSIFPTTLSGWWKQKVRWAVGGLQTLRKHIDCISKGPSGLRNFLIPSNLIGYILVSVGILFTAYRFSYLIINNILFIINSIKAGVNPWMTLFSLEYLININTFFAVILISFAIYLTLLNLKIHRSKFRFNEFAHFLLITPFLYFFVIAYGIYKYFYSILTKKEVGWVTK